MVETPNCTWLQLNPFLPYHLHIIQWKMINFLRTYFGKKTTVDLKKHAARSLHKFHEMLLIEETLHHWDV